MPHQSRPSAAIHPLWINLCTACGPYGWRVSQSGQPPWTSARVEVRRSSRRRRTVGAHREGDAVVVLMPAGFTAAEERQWVARMVQRLERRERRRRPSDSGLERRAARLSSRYLDSRARPSSVRWVDNQHGRWGSCSVDEASIRLSDRLQGMPEWVIDYVLVHELAHLLVPGHGQDFWELVARYPRSERARGYLDGFSEASGAGPDDADR